MPPMRTASLASCCSVLVALLVCACAPQSSVRAPAGEPPRKKKLPMVTRPPAVDKPLVAVADELEALAACD